MTFKGPFQLKRFYDSMIPYYNDSILPLSVPYNPQLSPPLMELHQDLQLSDPYTEPLQMLEWIGRCQVREYLNPHFSSSA